jgi:glutamate formiminotransferase
MIECVPNFSEGRDLGVVAAIRDAIAAVPGILVLGCESDSDHNRSVITFAGADGPAVAEAAVRGACKAAELIDLTSHAGVHPRIGAADVIPFIPLDGSTSMDECVRIAHWAGEELWKRVRVPAYFYEFAAMREERRRLEHVRKHGFELLRMLAVTNSEEWLPDAGGPALHPTAGAAAIGARRILIACNVNLATTDLDLAKRIARRVRASSGGFPHVKALGLALPSRGLVQVSMNLTHHEVSPLHVVYDVILEEAERAGVAIEETELIGFIPRAAAEQAPEFISKCRGFHASRMLETRIAEFS